MVSTNDRKAAAEDRKRVECIASSCILCQICRTRANSVFLIRLWYWVPPSPAVARCEAGKEPGKKRAPRWEAGAVTGIVTGKRHIGGTEAVREGRSAASRFRCRLSSRRLPPRPGAVSRSPRIGRRERGESGPSVWGSAGALPALERGARR